MNPATLAKRRQRILDAATKLFTEVDFHGVHMDAVATVAGVAKPTLYRYFGTKEALFFATLEQSLTQLAEEVERLCGQRGSIEACLRQAIGLIFERISRLAPALRAIEGQGAALKERRRDTLRTGFRRLRETIVRLLDRGVEQGEFKPFDTELAALAIVGAVRMASVVGPSKRKGADLVADLFLRGLVRDNDILGQDHVSRLDLTAGAVS
jgi:TetR/AcrR family transcriptional repressor of mexJK operon